MGKNIPQLYLEKCLFSHLSLCLSPAKSFYSSSQSGSQQQHIITRGVPIRSCGYRLDRNQMLHPDQGSYISIYRVRVSSLCLTLYLCLYLCLYLSIYLGPRHFTWQRKEYEKSSGWYGGTKCVLRLTRTSAGCTQGSAVTVQHLRLTSVTRKVVGQCWNSMCRIRKSHMKVHTLLKQNKINY